MLLFQKYFLAAAAAADDEIWAVINNKKYLHATYLLRTPPRSEALRHSGGERRLWTSATVTLYFDVELSRERRPGTEQKTSPGTMPRSPLTWWPAW